MFVFPALGAVLVGVTGACSESDVGAGAKERSGRAAGQDRGARAPLLVSAASDLRFAFAEMGHAFEARTGVPVTFNFGSTGHLARQIERGAPVDVFAAADVGVVDELLDQGLILPDTRAHYARGFLVLWSGRQGLLPFEALEDVARPGVRRIAIANPDHAPYGIAAREALQAADLWEAVQPRLVLAKDVNQALQYARSGNVDASIVALSLALAPSAASGRSVRIPNTLHRPIDQALGVVSSTRREAEARAFARFVTSPVGRAILERYGFAAPPRPTAAPGGQELERSGSQARARLAPP